MKRFWRNATYEAVPGGFRILLDGRPMRLPGGPALIVAQAALAEALRDEWQNAGSFGSEMTFDDVPLTRLAGTAQERIAPDSASVVESLLRYGETDLLCYRAERPEALVHRQAREWQPLLDWAALTFDAPLRVTSGVNPIVQPPSSIAALRRALDRYDAAALAGLGLAVPALGSLVLGLALAEGRLDADSAYALASLDAVFQEEMWGHDSTEAERRQRIGEDVALAARFMALAKGGGTA
jgi:chaperone required for assembly of F1-ATPase